MLRVYQKISDTHAGLADMAARDASARLSKSTWKCDDELHVFGMHLGSLKELMSSKSARVAGLLRDEGREEEVVFLLQDISGDAETFELVARFCHGFELNLSAENVIPLLCLAHYLQMTEEHCNNNLINKALAFFEQRVLPSWNETIKAFRSSVNCLQHAVDLGLIDAGMESLINKAKSDPCLLGEPIKNSSHSDDTDDDDDDEEEGGVEEVEEVERGKIRKKLPCARRKLFISEWKSEDLTSLCLQLYELVIHGMNDNGVPPEYVASSLCAYANKWVFCDSTGGENVLEMDMSICKKNFQRDVMEAVERLLPAEKGVLPCTLLFEMLRFSISLESSKDCRHGFEARIGKQLDRATVKDLMIPSQGYAKEVQYDIECVKRIMKHFYSNFNSKHVGGIIRLAQLIEDFLVEIASDIDLKIETFVSLAEISMAASMGTQKNSDGTYRAIDIYLDKHRYLTELEREEVCRVLDCHKLSHEAREHAAKNDRLPVRFVVQVLFVAQMLLRDSITRELKVFDDKSRIELMRQEEEEEEEEEDDDDDEDRRALGLDEEEVRREIEKMSIKVSELQRACHDMKEEIECGCGKHEQKGRMKKKKKMSMWKKVKRKLGCVGTSMNDCNCQVNKKKKVHPR